MQIKSVSRQLPFYLFAASLTLLVFGYYPLVTFGTVGGVHVDISLLYVLFGLSVVSSIGLLLRDHLRLFKNPLWLIGLGFTIFMSISVFWSPNLFRSLVTVGFWWLLFGFISICIIHYPSLIRHRKTVMKFVGGGLILTALWMLIQVIGEALGVPNAWLLLPKAYDGAVFGIARPTGFALEPQFAGSLLIAPLCWLTWLMITKKHSWWMGSGLLLTMTLLLLTLSRGALAAGFVALITLLILQKPGLRQVGKVGLVAACSMILSLVVIFSVATLRSDNVSGYGAVSRSVNHLSMGMLQLPAEPPADVPKKSSHDTTPPAGYVKSSTTSRLSMSEKALAVWRSSPQTLLFGVGSGGFGASLGDEQDAVRSIVNNYYLEILAELGLVGLGLFLAFFGLLLYRLAMNKHWLALSVIAGFLIQFCFFSGNANILHVWAIVGLSIAVLQHESMKHKQRAAHLVQ